MKVFVGFGYNERDSWIEDQVFSVLECMGFTVVHGKDMHGEVLQPEVQSRIDQSDAAVGFFTVRDGQEEAEFNSHIWVRDEMVYANARGKPIVPIREENAKVPDGLLGNRQYVLLRQNDRLACVVELARALGRRNIRRIRLEPEADELRRDLNQWRRTQGFGIRYRTQDALSGLESDYRQGRLEVVDMGFYLNVSDVPKRAYVEVEGLLNGQPIFNSGWASADAVLVRIN
ncbi:MAG TPA: hypothetical protein VGV87_12720 [Blastocatellia bacterium]|jgi:hypothetical protein|nr:hypothetical protein [Blastocatellia bacterium]